MKMLGMAQKYIKKHILAIIFFTIISLVNYGCGLIFPYYIGKFMDVITSSKHMKNMVSLIEIMISISMIQIVSNYVLNILGSSLNVKLAFELSYDIIEYVKKLPMAYFKKNDPTYLNQKINGDTNTVMQFITGSYIGIITNCITIACSLHIITSINKKITVMLIPFVFIYVLIYCLFKKRIYSTGYAMKETQSKFFAKINEQFYKIKLIKLNSWFQVCGNVLKSKFKELHCSVMKYARMSSLYASINLTSNSIWNMLLLFYGGIAVMKGNMSIGKYTMINTYFNMMLNSTNYFLDLGKRYQSSLTSYSRLKEVLDESPEINGTNKISEINEVSFNNISFSYDNDNNILDNFSCKFEKGHVYCIVGDNGAGKSTFVDMLLGILQGYKGEIKYDSMNVENLDLYYLRRELIGVTEQEPNLMNGTMKENITYGNENSNVECIDQLCEALGVKYLMDKFDDNVKNLSGGEKQKISLIRTLIKNPDLIILDEPTSALDKNSTGKLINMLNDLKKDKIIIVITHNNQFLDVADEIIMFGCV